MMRNRTANQYFEEDLSYDYPQGRTEEELLAFITPQLQAREPYYLQADYVIKAPVKDIAEQDDKNIAEQLCKLIKSKMK